MIKVLVKREKKTNYPLSVEIKGHALFAPSGKDIVCAGASTLSQTIVFAMEDLLQVEPAVKITEGYMFLGFPQGLEKTEKRQVCLLFETLLLGLKELSRAHPQFIIYNELRSEN